MGNTESPKNNYSLTTKLLSREFCDPDDNLNSYFEETQWFIKKKQTMKSGENEQNDIFTKEIRFIKNQTEILDLKNLMNEMKLQWRTSIALIHLDKEFLGQGILK